MLDRLVRFAAVGIGTFIAAGTLLAQDSGKVYVPIGPLPRRSISIAPSSSTCNLPPLRGRFAWGGGVYGELNSDGTIDLNALRKNLEAPKYDGNDSHTYNPYSSLPNSIAGINHDPKTPSEHGHWVTDAFKVSCWGSRKLYEKTYLFANIVNAKGETACQGGVLSIKNGSDKYPAYFGLSGVLNNRLVPGEHQNVDLHMYRAKNDFRHTDADITVKYWVDDGQDSSESGKRCSTFLEYYQALDATPRPKYLSETMNTLPWTSQTTISFPASGSFLGHNEQTASLLGVNFTRIADSTPSVEDFELQVRNSNPYAVFVHFYNNDPNTAGYIAIAPGGMRQESRGRSNCPFSEGCMWHWNQENYQVKILDQH